jgi:hypothetical protein
MIHTRFPPSIPPPKRRRLTVRTVLAALRDNDERLRLHFDRRCGPTWWLAGRQVKPEVAETVIRSPGVVGASDGLFGSSQTFRFEVQANKEMRHG